MYSFSGSSRPRPVINLGGAGAAASSSARNGFGLAGGDPVEVRRRAKAERAAREAERKREAAATRIQAFYRSRKSARATRSELRRRFDALLATPRECSNEEWEAEHIQAARLILVFYAESSTNDSERLASWARRITASDPGHGIPLFVLLKTNQDASWRTLLVVIFAKLLSQAAANPRSSQALLFLETANTIADQETYAKAGVDRAKFGPLVARLVRNGFFRAIAHHILAFSVAEKSQKTLQPAILLSILPFKNIPTSGFAWGYREFVRYMLTVPLLPNRIPIPALVSLSSGLPLGRVLEVIASDSGFIETFPLDCVVHLLGNILAFGSKRVPSLPSPVLKSYLEALELCLDRIPTEVFAKTESEHESAANAGKGKEGADFGHSVAQDITKEMDEDQAPFARPTDALESRVDAEGDVEMTNASAHLPTFDSKTYNRLATLPSYPHLSAILAASTRSSASTRPAFCGLLVTLLYKWSAHKERVVTTLVYGTGSARERGGGLLREIWRGYIRSGKLGTALRDRKAGGSPSGVLTAVNSAAYKGEWEPLILLAELYSRCLLTLGDDEFFNDHAAAIGRAATGGSQQAAVGRNPLMLEEVVGLAEILRNLAFGLYWTEGQADIKAGKVTGTTVGLEELRGLATRLLKQIHARDLRRPFCQPGFWLMTSAFDLQSFIQTVIYEDEQFEALGATSPEDAQSPPEQDDEGDEDDDHSQPTRPPVPSAARNRFPRRQMAFISPRLGVLNNIPFVIPFDQRVAIFRTFIENDRHRLGLERHNVFSRRGRHRATIRRGHVAEDGFATLNGMGSALKGTVEITFVDEHGMVEAGIDGGGVFKEFLTSLSKEAFDSDRGLWLTTSQQELYPNPHSYAQHASQLSWYTFLGRILGKALYEGILVDVAFAPAFLSKWLGKQSYLDDLAALDPQLYQGLLFLKNYDGDVESDLSLNFTVTNEEFGQSKTIDLIPNGRNVPVTKENRIQYIYLMSHYRLNVQIEKQCAAFFAGLSSIIEPKWMMMFNQEELRVLVGGTDHEVDVDDLRQNTVYGGWDESHETIRKFWRVVKSMEDADRRKLLKFVTSCSRPPLLGFRELRPSFAIRNAGSDNTRLPSASTCVNLLKLPAYASEDVMKQKLLYAVNANAGFDLS